MALPVRARVEAVPNFLATLDAVRGFFLEQDAESAQARYTRLKALLREMLDVLAWSPGSGRPARFLAARSAQARLRVAAVLELARQTGLPNLREYVVDQHVVLYAHAEDEVLLLAIKHQRQLAYSAGTALRETDQS
ncbi:MAG: type II toxin-antitoxin system RelE/ParE family toxin [Pseudomonadota bacterium]